MKKRKGSKIAKEAKTKLIQMARENRDKPAAKSRLGKQFAQYIYASSGNYDANFVEEIRSIRPDWLENARNRAARLTVQSVVEDAKAGLPRPSRGTEKGDALINAMKKESFRQFMIRLRPDWFPILTAGNNEITKDTLLQLAKSGANKPHPSSKAWGYMKSCMHPESEDFDPKFLADMITARPEWFNVFRSMKVKKAMSA